MKPRALFVAAAVLAGLSPLVHAQTASNTSTTEAPAPAATPQTQDAAPPASPTPSMPTTPTDIGPIAGPPDGKGQIVFFRPSTFRGAAVWFNVRENGAALGKLSNGRYFVDVVDPGPHVFTAATENHDVLRLEVDSGETLYVRGSISMGLLVGEANLSPSDAATFAAALHRMKPATAPTASAPVNEATAPPKT